jgi:hypothetical protein
MTIEPRPFFFFFNYTVQHRHSQRTRTHPYEHTHGRFLLRLEAQEVKMVGPFPSLIEAGGLGVQEAEEDPNEGGGPMGGEDLGIQRSESGSRRTSSDWMMMDEGGLISGACH